MPRQGFSIDDLLHPKSRRYNDENSSSYPTYGSAKHSMGRNAAKKMRKELKLQSVPVCLEPIIDYLMLDVVLIDNPDQIKALGRHLGNGRIEIVKGLPEILFRSTLAHEIGHAALNHDCRGRWDTLYSINDTDPHEKEAWDFAGEILMPDDIFRRELKIRKDPEHLANKFKVSKDFVIVEMCKRKLV
jgi:hypothetical protein